MVSTAKQTAHLMAKPTYRISRNGSAYQLTGRQGAPALVLIHGLGLHRQIWQAYLPDLEARFKVLNYDLFGHGNSTAPPKELHLSAFAAQLNDLLDELNIARPALLGFSLGGMINRRFALDYPRKVSALAILNSPHERAAAAQQQVEQRAADCAQGGAGANLDATMARWFTAAFRRHNPAYLEQIRGWLLANNAVYYAQSRQVLATGVLELIKPKPAINAPTLVMTCANDSGSTPAMAQAIAAEITGAQTQIVPTLQHMGLVERPELFIKPLLDFLA